MFNFFRRKPLDPREHPYAKATTPDELIAAHLIQSFVTDFDAWVERNTNSAHPGRVYSHYDRPTSALLFHITKEDVKISLSFLRMSKHGTSIYDDNHYFFELKEAKIASCSVMSIGVDEVVLEKKAASKIWEEYQRISKAVAETKRVAAEEKAKMVLNEKKWNLAETLLGMKRNEHGALVPAKCYCSGCKECGNNKEHCDCTRECSACEANEKENEK